MNYLWIFVVLNGFAVVAKPQSDLTCIVTQTKNALIYHLSRPPSFSECTTGWETANRTVIALNLEALPVVQNVSNQSLTLNYCEPFLLYTEQCFDNRTNLMVPAEVNCSINCTRFLNPKDDLTPTMNSTMICISESWCLPTDTFVYSVIGIAILLVVLFFVALGLWRCRGRQSETSRVLYTQASKQVEDNIKTPIEDNV